MREMTEPAERIRHQISVLKLEIRRLRYLEKAVNIQATQQRINGSQRSTDEKLIERSGGLPK